MSLQSTALPTNFTPPTEIKRWLGGQSFEQWRAQFDQDGYLIFNDVLDAKQVKRVREALAPHLERNVVGRNEFEGVKSNRVYNMLAKSVVFAELVTHPLALAFAEADLGRSCRLSACLAINLLPGESVQPWHHDDAHIYIPRPRPSYGVSTFWAIDAMTEHNGATELLPGSHLWSEADVHGHLEPKHFESNQAREVDDDPGAHPETVKAIMPSGSLMVAKGTVWHRGGANRSNKPRLIVTPQYCPGWARPLENIMAGTPREVAAKLPPRARELIGYSIHPPFMGYVDGVHPQKLLDANKR